MDEKIFSFSDNTFNQGEYAENKIKEIEMMNIENIQEIEKNRELKL